VMASNYHATTAVIELISGSNPTSISCGKHSPSDFAMPGARFIAAR
jgi:hypothetical protein